jgi:hypothetical protein
MEGEQMNKKGRNAGKKYARPLSLHPMKFEDAVKMMMRGRSIKMKGPSMKMSGPKSKKHAGSKEK